MPVSSMRRITVLTFTGEDNRHEARAATIQRRPHYSVHRTSPIGHYGTLHRRNLPRVWPSVERKPLLLTLYLTTTIHSVLPIDDEAVSTIGRLRAIDHALVRSSCPRGVAARLQSWRIRDLHSKSACIPGRQRVDPVRLHPWSQSSCFCILCIDSDHRPQCAEASQFAAQHLVVWQ